MHQRQRFLGLVLLIASTWCEPLQAQGFLVDLLADTSTEVPNGQAGERFETFRNPSISRDSVGPSATIAFAATGDMGTRGLYRVAGSGLEVVADTSIPVPGGPLGDTFASFKSPVVSGDAIAFMAIALSDRQGVYLHTVGGGIEVVADISTVVPGGAPGEQFAEFLDSSATGVWISGDEVVFSGVGDAGTTGIYRSVTGGAIEKMVDSTDPVPGGAAGEHFLTFLGPSLSESTLVYRGFGNMSTEGVFKLEAGSLSVIAQEGVAMPGSAPPGEIFADFRDPSASSGGAVFGAFGDLRGWEGLFMGNGNLVAVADEATSVPSGLPGETFFTFRATPSVVGDTVAFAGRGLFGTQGVYLSRNGSLRIVADTDTQIPGRPASETFTFLEAGPEAIRNTLLAGGIELVFRGRDGQDADAIYKATGTVSGFAPDVPTLSGLGSVALALILVSTGVRFLFRQRRRSM